MSTSMVRMKKKTHQTLRALAKRKKASMADVLDQAIEAYRRQQFLEDLNADFAALRRDDEQWQHEQQERAAWDATADDGLRKSE